tara:strand:- start:398 stop:592 length:195 start_codon:yes stop_codon:yes gene_type:complete
VLKLHKEKHVKIECFPQLILKNINFGKYNMSSLSGATQISAACSLSAEYSFQTYDTDGSKHTVT